MRSYSDDRSPVAGRPDRVRVGLAEYHVAGGDVNLSTSGVGSCLAVGVHDGTAGTAGLVHLMLPAAQGTDGEVAAKFVDAGIPALVEGMEAAGARRSRTVAKVAGGADLLNNGGGIGRRNEAAARAVLDDLGVPIEGTDLGGECGRTVVLDATTGEMTVRRATGEEVTI